MKRKPPMRSALLRRVSEMSEKPMERKLRKSRDIMP
jgi:hypothetical protein